MNRQTRPSELTGAAIADCDVYVIECRAKDGSIYLAERDTARAGWRDTVNDIFEGREENVSRVVAFNVGTSSCEDVTDAIAREVLALALADNGRVSDRLMGFLEGALSCSTVASAERELAS